LSLFNPVTYKFRPAYNAEQFVIIFRLIIQAIIASQMLSTVGDEYTGDT